MTNILAVGTATALALMAGAAWAQTTGSVGVVASAAGISLDTDANIHAPTVSRTIAEPGSNLKSATRKSRRDAVDGTATANAAVKGEASIRDLGPDGQ
nr:hypothetical protein [Sphingomonas sp. Y57]